MYKGTHPLFMGIAMLLFLAALAGGCAPTVSSQKPAENYQGPIAERPSHLPADYWIYQRPDGNTFRSESVPDKVEFPLWVGKIWKYRSSALPMGQPQTSKAHRAPTETTCEVVAFKPITVEAGSYEAFECRCECNMVGVQRHYEKNCGEWTVWYAPEVKNIVKRKTESTAYTFELADYNILGHLAQPKTARDFHNRGLSYRRTGEHDRAIHDFDEAIRLNPTYADSFNARGLSYANKKDYDRAIQDYNEALRLNPTHVFAVNNRGNAYLDKKQPDLAIADYDRSIAYDSNYSTAYFNRARAYSEKKDDERALRDYDMAIRINPKYGAALNNRGNIYRAKKDYDRAIEDYDEAIRSNPNYARAFNNRGNAYRGKGDDEGAIQDYDHAVRLDPNYALAFRNRGLARFDLGQFGAAAPDLAKALELQPSNLHTSLWLYLAETRAGQNGAHGLEGRSRKLDLNKWPGAVIDFYLGKIDEKAMYAKAENPDPKKKTEQTCEANFYAAEAKLLKGAIAEAIPLLRAAETDCPPTFIEKRGASAELKRLAQ